MKLTPTTSGAAVPTMDFGILVSNNEKRRTLYIDSLE